MEDPDRILNNRKQAVSKRATQGGAQTVTAEAIATADATEDATEDTTERDGPNERAAERFFRPRKLI